MKVVMEKIPVGFDSTFIHFFLLTDKEFMRTKCSKKIICSLYVMMFSPSNEYCLKLGINTSKWNQMNNLFVNCQINYFSFIKCIFEINHFTFPKVFYSCSRVMWVGKSFYFFFIVHFLWRGRKILQKHTIRSG